jgi:1,6-anhydro-N-acetylmuramate kinase
LVVGRSEERLTVDDHADPAGAMPRAFHSETLRADDGRRWTIGVAISSKCDRVSAVLVGSLGFAHEMLVEVAGDIHGGVPAETQDLFADLVNAANVPPPIALAAVRSQLADVESGFVNQLLSSRGVASNRILAVGVCDPGVWDVNCGETRGYLSLCDAARLAEATGLNVVDAFPARDLALGGQGGPVTAVAEWILLRSQLRHRVLVDLGRTVRIGFLPAASADRADAKILAFDVGPGLALVDAICARLSGGTQTIDHGGHVAVQGRRIPLLIEHWRRDPYFDVPPPRWHPHGVPIDGFLKDAIRMAIDAGWPLADLLCTATSFIAEMTADAIRRWMPKETPVDEILVTGGGQQNGLLLRELARHFERPLIRIADLNVPEQGLEAAAAGVLALLWIDQTPASQTEISRTATPRLLGRLTPGSPQSWKRLLEACVESTQRIRPLRSAM